LYDSKNPFVQVNIERALQDFLQLAARDSQRENVGAILGIATASMLLKQTPKARLFYNHVQVAGAILDIATASMLLKQTPKARSFTIMSK
jgi:hypothetical protein